MRRWPDLRIGVRLGAGFAFLIALLVALAAVGVSQIAAVDRSTETILHDRYPKVALAQTIENEVNRQSRALRTALIADEAAVVAAELAKIEQSIPVVAQAVERLQASVRSEAGRAALATMLDANRSFRVHESELVGMIRAGRIDEGRRYLLAEMLAPQQAYLAAVEGLARTQVDGMERAGLEAAEISRRATTSMLSLAGVAALLAIGLAIAITRSVTRPLAEAVKVAQTVADGDLRSRIEVRRRDETGQLLAALSAMNGSLAGIVTQVRASSDSIATGSAQIATGSADLSQRTEEQAANLQQTAASMDQITTTVQHSAAAARSAAEVAAGACTTAERGGDVVGRVVRTMGEISAESGRIAEITGVIDGIAFQTNILALNAAVEAARAGEHGRGFSIVAEEVRSLAQRAAAASKEIRVLVGRSSAKVTEGAALAQGAGSVMTEVVGQVRRVAELIAGIDAATQEQTLGIGQVGLAVNQLDQVTQQNAALVEESAAASDNLSRQALGLSQLVGSFKLDGAMPG